MQAVAKYIPFKIDDLLYTVIRHFERNSCVVQQNGKDLVLHPGQGAKERDDSKQQPHLEGQRNKRKQNNEIKRR